MALPRRSAAPPDPVRRDRARRHGPRGPAAPIVSDDPTDRPTSRPWTFVPRCCPNPACRSHCPQDPSGLPFEYRRWGFYKRLAAPGRIPRFRCRRCMRTCSSQTFSTTYYMKRPELLAAVARILVNAGCDRHGRRIVRGNAHYADHPDAGASGATITRLVPRLARHAALVLAEVQGRLADRAEALVADDFETFAVSQLHAVSVANVVGATSGFVYCVDQAGHPRGGTLTPAQAAAARRLREKGVLPPRDARAKAWTRVVGHLRTLRAGQSTIEIRSDGDTTIARCFERAAHGPAPRLVHRAIPNPARGPKGSPRSAEAAYRDSVMHEVDRLHSWFRHSMAHDRRETIAFARSVNALLSRKLIYALNRNVVQPHVERRRHEGTPAMILGVLPRPVSWDEILEKRRFLRHCPPLPKAWADAYFETIKTLGARPSRRRIPTIHRHA